MGFSRQEYWSGLPCRPLGDLPDQGIEPTSLVAPTLFSCSVVSNSLWPTDCSTPTRFPCPLPTPAACSNSCPLSRWCYPIISSSVIPFSSCFQSFPAPGSFPMSQFFTSGGQILELQLQNHFFQWIFRTDFLLYGLVGCPCSSRNTQESSWVFLSFLVLSFSFSIGPSNEYSGLISLRMNWLDLLEVQGSLKSLLQHHSSKASIHRHSAFFIVQLSCPCMTTGKTIALTKQIFVGKVISLLFNMLSRFVITFLLRSKHLLISWLQSPSAVILEPPKIVCHCFHCFPIYFPWSDGTGCHDLHFLNVEL